jgi:hypothetical protein
LCTGRCSRPPGGNASVAEQTARRPWYRPVTASPAWTPRSVQPRVLAETAGLINLGVRVVSRNRGGVDRPPMPSGSLTTWRTTPVCCSLRLANARGRQGESDPCAMGRSSLQPDCPLDFEKRLSAGGGRHEDEGWDLWKERSDWSPTVVSALVCRAARCMSPGGILGADRW